MAALSRPSRRDVRLSLSWGDDPPEKGKPPRMETEAAISEADTRENNAASDEAQEVRREGADDFRGGVVVTLSPEWRVIACPAQWLVQRRRGAEWRAVGYFLSRAGLIRFCDRLRGLDAAQMAALRALPPHMDAA